MRDKQGSLVLPRYNSASPGPGTTSPSTSPSTSAITTPNGSQREVALERGDSILLDIDIEDGAEMGDATLGKRQGTWWQPSMIASPFRTAVVSNLGSAVSSGWSRARNAVVGSSLTAYIRRVPALEKPFDLRDMPSGPNNI